MSLDGGPAPRVLYIDDDDGLCRLVKRGLERRGYEVVTASNGRQGVEAAGAEPFDVVAIDHYMPGEVGLDFLARLSEAEGAPPVIYVTGSDEIQVAIAALKAGAADYVLKSGSDDFLALLANSLDQAMEQVRLRRGKAEAEEALLLANRRLEEIVSRQAVLLREVNHRVANSLQLVSSLVHLQAAALKDAPARAALSDTQSRIAAIMQIHRRLYTSDDVEFVDMADYLDGLTTEISNTLSGDGLRSIRLEAEPIRLVTDKAVSVGVIVAELVTNALKYAYSPGQPGEVRVGLRAVGDGRLELAVEDDGCGMPPASTPARGTGLGQKVLASMARSLGSKVVFDPAHKGARILLAFAS
jgi:two-component sensor histidine kinase